MYDLTHVFRSLYFINPERVRHSIKIHKEFIDAIEKRNPDLAEKIRKNMVRTAYEYLIEAASKIQPPYSITTEKMGY